MAAQVVDAPRTSIFRMDPDLLTLVEKPGQYYDKRVHLPVSEELVDSIITLGIIQPIVAVKDGDEIIVVAGRQRVKACREAKHKGSPRLKVGPQSDLRIPVQVKQGDEIRMEGIGFAENEIRTADDAVTRAEKMAYYLDLCGDAKKVGVVFGVSAWTVNNHIKVLDLCKPVKAALAAGKLSTEAAMTLHGLSAEDAGPKLEALLAGGNPTKAKGEAIRKGGDGAGGGGSTPGPKAPSRKLLVRLTEVLAEKLEEPDADEDLSEEGLNLLRWSLGLIDEATLCKRERWVGDLLDLAREDKGAEDKGAKNKAPAKAPKEGSKLPRVGVR